MNALQPVSIRVGIQKCNDNLLLRKILSKKNFLLDILCNMLVTLQGSKFFRIFWDLNENSNCSSYSCRHHTASHTCMLPMETNLSFTLVDRSRKHLLLQKKGKQYPQQSHKYPSISQPLVSLSCPHSFSRQADLTHPQPPILLYSCQLFQFRILFRISN